MLVVVGGHTRNIGKTAVVSGLIAALPEFQWTAMKITPDGHDLYCGDGAAPAAADGERAFAISEETDGTRDTDTSRFLAAGARRAYWVRTAPGQLGHAFPSIRHILEAGEHVIAESNSILQFLKPELYLVVMDFGARDFKPTSLDHLDRADALIVIDRGATEPAWSGVARQLWESKPKFLVRPPQWVTEAMAALVRGRLNSSTTSSDAAGPRARTEMPGDVKLPRRLRRPVERT